MGLRGGGFHGQRPELGAVQHAPLHLAEDSQGRAVLEQPVTVDTIRMRRLPCSLKETMKKLAFAVSLVAVGILVLGIAHAQGRAKTVVDAEWVIKANEAHSEAFTTAQQVTLQVTVKGTKNADKGFRVRVVNAEDVTSCRVKGGTCRELPAWKQEAMKAFTKMDKIPPGKWALLVENDQNIVKSMIVHVVVSVKE